MTFTAPISASSAPICVPSENAIAAPTVPLVLLYRDVGQNEAAQLARAQGERRADAAEAHACGYAHAYGDGASYGRERHG